jgi:NAD-dependent SIR2 family protein deacetylase
MSDLKVTEWTLEGVLDHISRIHGAMKDRQFAFILGAGASFTSGIPTGQELAQQWLKD